MKSLIALSICMSSTAFAQEATKPADVGVTSMTTAAPIEVAAPEIQPEIQPETQMVTTAPKVQREYPYISLVSYGYFVFGQGETFKTNTKTDPNYNKPYVKRSIDLAAIAFEGSYILTDSSLIEFEVEVEHGGTGTAMEFDPFEEFGEFETEVEKGGEVVLPEFVYMKNFKQTNTLLKIGKFPIFMTLGTILEKPRRYPTVFASGVEAYMLPPEWNETGVQVEQKYWELTGRLGLVSGLNSEFFRSYSWVGGGYQRQFETINADDMATVVSLEYGSLKKGTGVALAYYTGNTTDNRWKKDKLTVDSNVEIWSLLLNYKFGRFGVSGEAITGTLQNSSEVVKANATLGGLAKPKSFVALGSKAVLQSLQVSYDFTDDFVFYLKTEHVDSFADVEGSVQKLPRYDVSKRSSGFMWNYDKGAFMKAQYTLTKTGLDDLPETYQADLAFGFDIAKFN
ncbi:hypothetical protein [Bdellovibrio svalbardensis]|uniref:Porin n=1 Tax=Bdellovibrio svalbardensis TaxID=2972972 RepID=A0ABT6DKB6_9BACT|nr:hypothetical protein [Bdellovibrio svalbardensis]MDG0816984.1 hypothetical protein [Bdellovibrio svalbardensis]